MSREHNHHHHHVPADAGGGRILIALLLNVGIVVAQVIGGILSGSLALIADAVHNGSDAASLGISYGARRVAGRDPDHRRTFGYARVETVAAVVNLTTLIVIALYLVFEGTQRLFRPEEVDGTIMLVVAVIALVEDVLSVMVLYPLAKSSMNVRAATLHLVADTLSTVVVLVGAIAVTSFGIYWIDPLLTLLLAVFILVHALRELRMAASVLIESAPEGFDMDAAVEAVESVPGVEEMHHVHVWQIDEHRVGLEAHLVMDRSDLGEIERVKREAKEILHDRFGIEHSTLEVEVDACVDHERSVVPMHEAGHGRHLHAEAASESSILEGD